MFNLKKSLAFSLGLASLCFSSYAETVDALLIPYQEIELSFPIYGKISTILVKEGDSIKKGDTLATLERKEEILQLKKVEHIIKKRQFDLESSENLFKKNMLSKDEFLEKKIEMDLSSLEKEIALNKFNNKELKAPIHGSIVKRNFEISEWIEPGKIIFVLINNSKIYAEILLTPIQAKPLKKNQTLALSFSEIGEKVTGKVEFISPKIDPTSNLIRIKILIQNDKQLSPGITGQLTLP